MACNNQFRSVFALAGAPACRADCRCKESPFRSFASRKNNLAARNLQALQFRSVIQAENAALQPAARGELRQHRRQVPPRALHSAGRIQFGKKSNQHSQSLPGTRFLGKVLERPFPQRRKSVLTNHQEAFVLDVKKMLAAAAAPASEPH
jgi:hypothetical protein